MRSNDTPGQSSSQVDRALLARFVAGEASPADVAAVERWLAEDPAREDELAELRRIWRQAGVLPSEERLEGLWRDLHRRMHEQAEDTSVDTLTNRGRERPPLRLLRPQRSRRRRWVVGALVAAGLAAVAAGVALESGRLLPAGVFSPVSERVYRTARGQRAVVELADGSRVQLGADSKLAVRLRDGGRREATLEGEAVFDVVHDARRPFLVYARNAVTEDLGTKFGVRAYPSDSSVRVVVVTGKVAFGAIPAGAGVMADTGRGVVLAAEDEGELGSGGDILVRRRIEPEVYLAWAHDRLVFRDTPVPEVTASLERWYDVAITIADSTARARRLTLDLTAPSLEEALEAVAVPLGLRYERVGRRVALHR